MKGGDILCPKYMHIHIILKYFPKEIHKSTKETTEWIITRCTERLIWLWSPASDRDQHCDTCVEQFFKCI